MKNIINTPVKQWVDGSYVTKKLLPNDMDIVTFINHEDFKEYEKRLEPFFYPNSKKNYNIDAYLVIVYHESHKKNFYYKSDYVEWLTNFSKDFKTNKRKGFLEITV